MRAKDAFARRTAIGRLAAASRRDDGNAMIEFVALAVILLIPCLYLVLTLGKVQAAVFAADVIARDSARIQATEPDQGRAEARTRAMVDSVLAAHRLEGDSSQVLTVSCSAHPCARAGESVTATVRISVSIPGLGPMLGQEGPIRIGATHMAKVDEYRDLAAPPAEENR